MRKALITVTAALLFSAVTLPAIAFADNEDDDSGWSSPFDDSQLDSHHKLETVTPSDPDDENRHHEIDGLYDDFTGVPIPPVVIRPEQRTFFDHVELPMVPNLDNADPARSLLDIPSDKLAGIDISADGYMTISLTNSGALEPIPASMLQTKISSSKYKTLNIRDVVLNAKTTSDEFMDKAWLFGAFLVALAVGLIALTGANSIRASKSSGENSLSPTAE